MNKRFVFRTSALALATLVSLAVATACLGQGTKTQLSTDQKQKVIERHKKIAEMHTKLAACIESEKTPSACRQEMIDSCSANFGDNCPLNDLGKRGSGGQGKTKMRGPCMDWMMGPDVDAPVPAPVDGK